MGRKCVIKSKDYINSYSSGDAMYGDLLGAKIYDQDKIADYLENSSNNKIIFLDSEEGLELIVEEIAHLDNRIPQEERKLREMKEAREKFFNSNPEMVSRYIQKHNQLNNPLIGISPETKRRIVKEIVEQN